MKKADDGHIDTRKAPVFSLQHHRDVIWVCVNKGRWQRWMLISAKVKWILTLIQIVQIHCAEKSGHECIWFHFFQRCTSPATETAQGSHYGSFPSQVWRLRCSFKCSTLLRLTSQCYLFCLINVVKAEITGIPPGIIRNKSLFIRGKFSSRMCACLSHKEVIRVSVSILMPWNSILLVKSIRGG